MNARLVLLAVALAACGAPATNRAPASVPVAPTAHKSGIDRIIDELCACKDHACVTDVSARAHKVSSLDTSHHVAMLACRRKAHVFAAASLVPRAVALADKRCACKTGDCDALVRAEFETLRAGVLRHNDLFAEFPLELRRGLDKAANRLDRCSNDVLTLAPGGGEAHKMSRFADRMCACKHAACAQQTHKDMMVWIKAHFKGGKRKGTKHLVEVWKRAQQQLNKCYIDLMKAGVKPAPAKSE